MNDIRFTPDELATLREHGIVLFADRVIFEAQPPIEVKAGRLSVL